MGIREYTNFVTYINYCFTTSAHAILLNRFSSNTNHIPIQSSISLHRLFPTDINIDGGVAQEFKLQHSYILNQGGRGRVGTYSAAVHTRWRHEDERTLIPVYDELKEKLAH